MRHPITPAIPALSLALAALTLGACHQAPSLGTLEPASGRLSANEAYPAIAAALDGGASAERTFRIDSGDDAGRTATRSVRPAGEAGSAIVSWTVGDEPGPRHESTVRRNADALVVTRMPNRERDVATRFDPPLLHMPGVLESGSPAEQEITMLVADFDRPDRVTRRGQATSTITLAGTDTLLVDGERTNAALVRTELVSSFGPARVNRVTDRWFVSGTGLVGERFDETVRIFGVVSERRNQSAWLENVEPVDEQSDEDAAGG